MEGAKRGIKGSDGVETPSNKDGLTIKKEAEGEMGLKANGQKAKGLKAKEAEGEMKANPAAKLYKKESLAPKGELGIKRKACIKRKAWH